MKTILKGTVLITGGSSGIGLEYARQLAARGCELVLVSNKQEELDAAAKTLEEEFAVRVRTRFQDLAANGAADKLFEWCHQEQLEIEILVSNAGMFFLGEITQERYDKAKAIVGLHVETPTRLCILFGNDMKKRGHGTIISMASLAADMPVPGITLYAATKSYLKAFGRAMVHELRPYGVGMTTVCPGAVCTTLYGLREDLMRFAVRIGVIKTPQWLVRRVLRAAEHRRAMVKAGLLDRMMPLLIRLAPSHLETWIWKRASAYIR